MTLEEFKNQFKLTPEEEVVYEKKKKDNLRKRNAFMLIKKNCFGISLVSLLTLSIIPFYLTVIIFLVFGILGIFFQKKHDLYESIVHVNNMTLEDHYEFFKSLDDK
jgi:hypothetical protein